jgi:hypothetical protein
MSGEERWTVQMDDDGGTINVVSASRNFDGPGLSSARSLTD